MNARIRTFEELQAYAKELYEEIYPGMWCVLQRHQSEKWIVMIGKAVLSGRTEGRREVWLELEKWCDAEHIEAATYG